MAPQMSPYMQGQPGSAPRRPTTFNQIRSSFGQSGLGAGFGSGFGSGFGYGSGYGSGYGQMTPPIAPSPMNASGVRQYTLEATQGFPGSGIATISGELQLMVVASLPPPATFVNTPSAAYVAYLVDKKGQQGFAAGKMTPSRDGACHLSFRSPVPLSNYTRVVISIEDPRKIQACPQGPIVLKVKDDFRSRLTQGDFAKGAFNKAGSYAKKAGGFVQRKIGGIFRGRFGKTPAAPLDSIAPGVNPAAAAQELGAAGAGAAGIAAAGIGAGIGTAAAHQAVPNVGPPQAAYPVPPTPQTPPQTPPQVPPQSYPQGYPQGYPQDYIQTQNPQPPTQAQEPQPSPQIPS